MEDKLLSCAGREQQHQEGIRETERLDENSRRRSGNQEAAEKSAPTKAAEKPATKKAAPAPTPVAKMTKTQIVKAMAEKLAAEPKQIQSFLDALAELATEQTREAGEFTIPGLGKLVKAERKERMGRNPATGEEMKITAKTAVKFRVAKAVTDAIAPPRA